jgi:hypothetical protein
MNVQPIDLGDELRQGVQFRLDLAPIVIRRPIARKFCIVASCTPCDSSVTNSRSGQIVACMRLRSSTSSASGTLMRNGRIAALVLVSSTAAVAWVGSKLAAPAAADVARTPRRVADVLDMTLSFDAIECGVVNAFESIGAKCRPPVFRSISEVV